MNTADAPSGVGLGVTPTFGFGIPQYAEQLLKPGALVSLVAQVEETTFSAVWASENLNNPAMSPLPLLAHVAAATSRLKLGVGVILLPLRIPVALARDVSTIDVLSGGRMIVGVGFGRRRLRLYGEYGVPPTNRLRRYLGGLEILRDLLERGSSAHSGPEWTMTRYSTVPTPLQRPRPPIWIAGRAELAIRRSVHIGDGWLGSGKADRSEIERSIGYIHDELERAGRDRSTFAIARRVYVLLDPTPSSVQRLMDWYTQVHGDGELARRVVLIGDVDDCAAHVTELIKLGADHVVLNPVFDFEDQLEKLATNVLPAVSPRREVTSPESC